MGARKGGEAVRRIRRLLLSRGAAVTVMAAMAGALALASFVPEVDSLSPEQLAELGSERPLAVWLAANLRPQKLVASPYFMILPGFLVLAITLSVTSRTRVFLAQRRTGGPLGLERFRVRREIHSPLPPAQILSSLRETLSEDGYELSEDAEAGQLSGRRGKVGFVGSIMFHVGLLLLVLGITLSAWSRLTAEIHLAEGFPMPLAPSSFAAVIGEAHFPAFPGTELAIRDMVAEYTPQGSARDYSVLLSVLHEGQRVEEVQVRVNQNHTWEGLQFSLNRFGFAPELQARNPEGEVVLDGVGLLSLIPAGRVDALELSDGGHLEVRLYPDFVSEAGEPATRSPVPNKPVVAFRWLDAEGKQVAEGLVGLAEERSFGGYRLRFESLRKWGGFVISRDYGLWLFIAASLVGGVGLGVRMAFPDQTVLVQCTPRQDGAQIELTASTRFFPALFEQWAERLLEQFKTG